MRSIRAIQEKLWDLDEAVDKIFNQVVKPFMAGYRKKTLASILPDFSNYLSRRREPILFEQTIADMDLPSPLKEVGEKKPNLTLSIVPFSGSRYVPNQNRLFIALAGPSFWENLLALNPNKKLTVEEAMANYDGINAPAFRKELTETRLRQSIRHELTHLLDDTNHYDLIDFQKKKLAKLGQHQFSKTVYTMTHETNAMINDFAEVKRSMTPEEWDSLTFQEALAKTVTTRNIYLQTKQDPKLEKLWKNYFLKRLAREGLLGKNMAKTGDDSVLN